MGASTYPTSVWDGTSDTRPDADVYRAPDADDLEQLRLEILALQNQLVPLMIQADGALQITPGVGVDEVQTLGLIASTSGNWTLTFTVPGTAAITTASLSFDVNAAELETAIDTAAALVTPAGWTAGDISVSGASDMNVGDIVLTFDGTSVAKMVIALSSTADVDLNDSTPPVVVETTPGIAPNANPATTLWADSAIVTVG